MTGPGTAEGVDCIVVGAGLAGLACAHGLVRAGRSVHVLEADEVFSTGNYAKVKPCTKVDDRHYQTGPVATRARELYFAWARANGKPPASS